MDILITAFTPFGDFSENKSAEVMNRLPENEGIKKLLLPTSYGRSASEMIAYISENPVKAVVMLGQAPRNKITVERVAINTGDCSMPDNDGVILTGVPLEKTGPAAYFSTLPIKKMLAAADCQISNTAGTYVCNSLMYRTLHWLDGSKIPCGFVHIPQDGDAGYYAAELMKMVRCI